MGLISRRKNKKFSYEPRYYKSDKEGSPFQMEHKFDAYRKTVGSSGNLKSKFKSAFQELREGNNRKSNRLILFIAALLVFLFLYIIDFDLSIFTQTR
ncbi:riboflavin synthase subunit beta [Altibacter sp. HG106]|uniref:riboflavin synthase subunit beta n=1 Tax=Altibacter sp. HG106 TaxID=3023937 RepID=UPI002350F37B|nr:riboflavin synthase subunit beta [Altibacter sp. HG106]MDC7995549.1 riboflavin synthase subunit beta [Altibacter sp. HG106]